MKRVERILVPTDGSAGAAAAGEVAARLAQDLGATVDVVTVVDTSPLLEAYGDVAFRTQRIAEIRAIARQHAEALAKRQLSGVASVAVHVRDGETYPELIQAARDFKSDLIIMGTHGRTGMAHLLIGSVAEKVVRASHVPVMTVRIPDELPGGGAR
jgi:nucleotide-binding universal stress UspA family protein